MPGSSVLSTFAVGGEPTSNRGRQTLLPLTVMTSPMSLANQPVAYASTQGARLHAQIFGVTSGASGVVTFTGKAPDGVTVVTESTPSVNLAALNAAGIYEYCTKAVFGSVDANGITFTGGGGAFSASSMIVYGILSAKRLIAGKFVAVEDLPEFSPQDNRGLLDEDVRMAQLNKKVTWTLDSTLYPEDDQFFGHMAVAQATNPATAVSIPGTPTSLMAATAFSGTPFTLTTQPKSPGQILVLTTSGNLVKGSLTVPGTNPAGEAITETIKFPAGDTTQYSENVFASVGSITKSGMTGAATCTIGGAFCFQPAYVPDQSQLLTFAGEHYDGVVGNVLPFMYATDWSLDYDVTKELKFSLKGEAQDYVPLGDRSLVDQTVNANPFSYTQPSDYPIVGWPGYFYIDPLANSAGTTQVFNMLTFKISGATGMMSYMTSNGTQEWNQVGRKRRKTTFEATVDFVTLQNYEAFRAFQKRSYVAKFQAGQASPGGYLGVQNSGALLYKYVQVTMYARQVKFAREGSDEKVIGKISGTCEYTMSQGLSFRLDFQNQNNPNYLL